MIRLNQRWRLTITLLLLLQGAAPAYAEDTAATDQASVGRDNQSSKPAKNAGKALVNPPQVPSVGRVPPAIPTDQASVGRVTPAIPPAVAPDMPDFSPPPMPEFMLKPSDKPLTLEEMARQAEEAAKRAR